MAAQGGSFQRTKHLLCKYNFIKDKIDNGEISVKYLPSNDMSADILTKPLDKTKLQKHLKILKIK